MAKTNTLNKGGLGLKFLLLLLLMVFFALQFRLWAGEDSLLHTAKLQKQLKKQKSAVNLQNKNNQQLAAEITALKTDLGEVEAKARKELGLIKPEETFFYLMNGDGVDVVDKSLNQTSP